MGDFSFYMRLPHLLAETLINCPKVQVCPLFIDENDQTLLVSGTGHERSRNGHFVRSCLAISAASVCKPVMKVSPRLWLCFTPLAGSSRFLVPCCLLLGVRRELAHPAPRRGKKRAEHGVTDNAKPDGSGLSRPLSVWVQRLLRLGLACLPFSFFPRRNDTSLSSLTPILTTSPLRVRLAVKMRGSQRRKEPMAMICVA
jgi:hypothetical protein